MWGGLPKGTLEAAQAGVRTQCSAQLSQARLSQGVPEGAEHAELMRLGVVAATARAVQLRPGLLLTWAAFIETVNRRCWWLSGWQQECCCLSWPEVLCSTLCRLCSKPCFVLS
jgi:hypothetical protein